MATVKEIIELAESKMHKTTDVLRVDLASVRAGRATPALLEKVEEEVLEEPENPNPGEPQPDDEYPEWIQPTGAHDAYAQGAKVSHNGKKWTSDIPANVYEPGVYGWMEVI